jgi:ribosomal protein S18 acetylase RimI-like enzyme
MSERVAIRRYAESDLPGVLRLCAIEDWPSLLEDVARAHRALTAPGVTTLVAVKPGQLLGFAKLHSDGEIQAHLSYLVVDPTERRKGIGRQLIEHGLREAGGVCIDLLTNRAGAFFASLPHVQITGYRMYPSSDGGDRKDPRSPGI